jgi:hypothetical protein
MSDDFNPKPGDWVAVQVAEVREMSEYIAVKLGVGDYLAEKSALRPIPQPDPLTELERKVVDEAVNAIFECNKSGVYCVPRQSGAFEMGNLAISVAKLFDARHHKNPDPRIEAIARKLCIQDGKNPDEDWRRNGNTMLAVHCTGNTARWTQYQLAARDILAAIDEVKSDD